MLAVLSKGLSPEVAVPMMWIVWLLATASSPATKTSLALVLLAGIAMSVFWLYATRYDELPLTDSPKSTDFSKDTFMGKEALLEVKKNGPTRQLIAFTMEERGIPRQGYEIFIDLKNVGVVTSGTQSPILKKGIGLAYVDCPFHKSGQEIFISIRDQLIPARIIKSPFIKDTSLHH